MAHVNPTLPGALQPPMWLSEQGDEPADIELAIRDAFAHKRHRERWKYTKVQPVLDLLQLPTEKIRWGDLPRGVSLTSLTHDQAATRSAAGPDRLFGRNLRHMLAWAPEAAAQLCLQPSVQLIEVSGEVSQPLIIDHATLSAPVIIRVADNARLDLREIYNQAEGDQVQSLWVELGNGSHLLHSRNSFTTNRHWQFLRVEVGRDASYELHNHCGGSSLRRQDVQITCGAPGAHAEITSAAYVGEGLHLDQQVTIEHTAANTTSEQTFHNIAGDRAKVTFNGRIHIHEQCGKVDAVLSNKNLSLGDNAVINTKPELEIYTDDVKCAHGATVGRLDDAQLFYCESRGIPPAQARHLLSRAFLNVCTSGPLADDAHSRLTELAGG